MDPTIRELMHQWADKCKETDVDLIMEGCSLRQELESMEIHYPSSIADIRPADSALCFAIRCEPWLAIFWACFAVDSRMKISDCYLSFDTAENARVSDIPLIEKKGQMAWEAFKGVFEGMGSP